MLALAALVSLSARVQRGMIMRAHAAHRTQLLESISAICGGRQEVKKSASMKLCRSCGSKRGTRHESLSQGRNSEDSRGQGRERRTLARNLSKEMPPPVDALSSLVLSHHGES